MKVILGYFVLLFVGLSCTSSTGNKVESNEIGDEVSSDSIAEFMDIEIVDSLLKESFYNSISTESGSYVFEWFKRDYSSIIDSAVNYEELDEQLFNLFVEHVDREDIQKFEHDFLNDSSVILNINQRNWVELLHKSMITSFEEESE